MINSCKILRCAVCVMACGLLFLGCKKEQKLEIPEQLAGTTWETYKMDGSTVELSFFEGKCTLSMTAAPAEGGEKGETTFRDYRYTYAPPRLQLVGVEDETDRLTGEVTTDGKHTIYITLYNQDNSFNEMFGKMIW